MAIPSNIDGLTDDSSASVSQDSEQRDTAGRDYKGTPRFLRENNPDGFGGVFESDGSAAPHSPAMVQYEGAPPAGKSSEEFKSTSRDALARRKRNKADLVKKRNAGPGGQGVVDTTRHPD